MGALFWLSDAQWAVVQPHLPKNQPGARRVDDRRVISGIFHVLKIGCRWQDCPAEYGPSTTVYNRFNRWSHKRFWFKLLDDLAATGAVTKSTAVDSTCVKAQRSAFGGKGGQSSGDRPLARRPDDQDPRSHRRRRPTLRAEAHAWERLGHHRRTGAPDPRRRRPLRPGRQGLRRRQPAPHAPPGRRRAGHPQPDHAQAEGRLRPTSLPRSSPHRERLLQAQGLPPRRPASTRRRSALHQACGRSWVALPLRVQEEQQSFAFGRSEHRCRKELTNVACSSSSRRLRRRSLGSGRNARAGPAMVRRRSPRREAERSTRRAPLFRDRDLDG